MLQSTPFSSNKSTLRKIQRSFAELLQARQDEAHKRVLSPENMLRYYHGTSWKHPANAEAPDASMEEHSAEVSIPSQRIVDGELALIDEVLADFNQQLETGFMRALYGLINETCDRTGNVISAKETGVAEAFAQMLERIPFSVGRNGDVNMPELHTPDPQSMLQALNAQPEEFHQRIEQIKKRKTEEALKEEDKRKSKFKRDDE
jgi:hypothetical protein